MQVIIEFNVPEIVIFNVDKIGTLNDIKTILLARSINFDLVGESLVGDISKSEILVVHKIINTLKYDLVDDLPVNTKYIDVVFDKKIIDIEFMLEYNETINRSQQLQMDVNTSYILQELDTLADNTSLLNEKIDSLYEMMNKDGMLYYRDTINSLMKIIENKMNLDLTELKETIFKREQ